MEWVQVHWAPEVYALEPLLFVGTPERKQKVSVKSAMEMPQLWKSAQDADSHSCLENSPQKTLRVSHIPTAPAANIFHFQNQTRKTGRHNIPCTPDGVQTTASQASLYSKGREQEETTSGHAKLVLVKKVVSDRLGM